MGKTAFQKIVEQHKVKIFPDGRMVLRLDRVWCHEITTPPAILDARMRSCDVVFDPNKIKAMIDHVNPAKDTASALQGKILREWCEEQGVEFLDVGRNGVCHAVIPEKGWILPGEIGIMGDSHTCTHGAFCAFAAGVGTTDLENGLITGLWVCPPQKVIRVNFVGNLPLVVFSKDLILYLINKIGVKGATNAVLEFGGNVVGGMSMDARLTITNMAVEAGATSGMMLVDEETIRYLWPLLKKRYRSQEAAIDNFSSWNSDLDAEYDQVVDIDVSQISPLITNGYNPGEVVKVSELAGKKINQVYIGSCTNGRIDDMRIAAAILKGKKVADNVRCLIVPATQEVALQMVKEGLTEIFLKSGCLVSNPTCGACLGMSCGVLAPGEVCVSTTNRNFPGRMGKDGMVHLASPATAAVSAISGVITNPTVSNYIYYGRSTVIPSDYESENTGRFQTPDYSRLLELVDGGKAKSFSGRTFYLDAKNVDTDQIIPAKYLTEVDKAAFGQHCLEDAPIPKKERPLLYKSKILVARDNFGCGSSREHAPWALEGAGITCVIAPSFARIFQENMFANGLLCVTLRPDYIERLFQEQPKDITISLSEKWIRWLDHNGAQIQMILSLSAYQCELIENGGSLNSILKLAAEAQKEGKI